MNTLTGKKSTYKILSSLFTDTMIRKFASEISMTKAAVIELALLEYKNAQ